MTDLPIQLAVWSLWPRWLLPGLSRDVADTSPSVESEFLFTNLPTSWGVFVLIAVIGVILYAIFAMYRREMSSCPRWAKSVLATLRSGVVLLLICIFLGPAVVYLEHRTVQPTIVLARDASQSMNTADAYADPASARLVAATLARSESEIVATRPTRTQIVNELLAKGNHRWLAALARKGSIQAIDFADQVATVDMRHGLPPLVAEGRGTDLWNAIRSSLAVDRPAAVVLFTDGQHTAHDDPLEAAREAGSRGVPLFIVGVGDPTRHSNVGVAKVYSRPHVWPGEPFEIDAVVTFQDAAAADVRVQLLEQRIGAGDQPQAPGRVVQSQQLAAPQGGSGQQTVRFSHTADSSGRYQYEVRVESIERDSDAADNQAASNIVNVLDRQRLRVLLVSGAPTWDYRLVQQLLARDKTMTLSCWLQTLDEERPQEGTRAITHLPVTREELFDYDVLLLFDPSPQEIDAAWIDLVEQFVSRHAGGLLYMAGPKYTSQLLAGRRTAAFANLLPVSVGDVGALEVASLLSGRQQAWPLRVVAANADNPVLRFALEHYETVRRWQTLPGIFWSFPAQAARPTAQVLLEHSDPALDSAAGARPLLVAGRYGAGRTLYVGFSGAWRWRKAGQQAEFFDKFWIQAIRYLAEGRSFEGRRRGELQTERDRYEVGERVAVTARLHDATYQPLVVPQINVEVQIAGEPADTLTLAPVQTEPGLYQGTYTARKAGPHLLRIPLSDNGTADDLVETNFSVELPSAETSQVWLNRPLLMELANISGGRYLDISQLDEIAAAIPDRTETIEMRSQPRPLWDVPGMLVALISLLAAEWLLRKRFKLL